MKEHTFPCIINCLFFFLPTSAISLFSLPAAKIFSLFSRSDIRSHYLLCLLLLTRSFCQCAVPAPFFFCTIQSPVLSTSPTCRLTFPFFFLPLLIIHTILLDRLQFVVLSSFCQDRCLLLRRKIIISKNILEQKTNVNYSTDFIFLFLKHDTGNRHLVFCKYQLRRGL